MTFAANCPFRESLSRFASRQLATSTKRAANAAIKIPDLLTSLLNSLLGLPLISE